MEVSDLQFAITTQVGLNVLHLDRFTGEEEMSRLFHFRVELLGEADIAILFDQLKGQKQPSKRRDRE